MILATSDTGAPDRFRLHGPLHFVLLHASTSCFRQQILRGPHHGNHRNCNPCLLADVLRSWRTWVEEVPGTFSPVYWGRYVDWVLTTPLMLWDILALAGAPNDEIAMVVIMDMLMIGFGCAGAQTP